MLTTDQPHRRHASYPKDYLYVLRPIMICLPQMTCDYAVRLARSVCAFLLVHAFFAHPTVSDP